MIARTGVEGGLGLRGRRAERLHRLRQRPELIGVGGGRDGGEDGLKERRSVAAPVLEAQSTG